MSETLTPGRPPGATDAAGSVTASVPTSLGESFHSYVSKVRSGEIGSLPAAIGIVGLYVFFAIAQSSFASTGNIYNIVREGGPRAIMAMGLVFVLLLGEIDLSAGVVGSAAAIFGVVLSAKHGAPWPLAILGATVFGAVCGLVLGWLRARVGIPSFVVTLAAFIAFQGVEILVMNASTGTLSISDNTLIKLDNGRLTPTQGWFFLVICMAGYAAVKFLQRTSRTRAGLAVEPWSLFGLRVLGLAVIGGVLVYLLNVDEAASWQQREGIHQWGVPLAVPIIVGLLVILTFILSKTRYGRHVYAVGGSNEAARRAGIQVQGIRISVFVICSTLSAFSGLLLASESRSINVADGGGNTLLLAVAAAVIGGTSLMGGRGRVVDGVLGAVALAILINGMSDLLQGTNAAAWQFIVEGIVLLVAAGVDALSRHSGRASS
jgi:D-xylose transport system permease protein